MSDWSTRIPTAIAKAEKLLGSKSDYARVYKTGETFVLTAGEVALAKALWHEMSRAMDRMNGTERAAFIAGFRGATIRYFTEKLERLSND